MIKYKISGWISWVMFKWVWFKIRIVYGDWEFYNVVIMVYLVNIFFLNCEEFLEEGEEF